MRFKGMKFQFQIAQIPECYCLQTIYITKDKNSNNYITSLHQASHIQRKLDKKKYHSH